MSQDLISLKVPAKPEYVMVARLTSSAVASRIGFDVDDIEDIKMSVAEAIILVMDQDNRPEELLVNFMVDSETMGIEILGQGRWVNSDTSGHDLDQSGLGKYIISSIMDDVEFQIEKGIVRGISMHKGCGGLMG